MALSVSIRGKTLREPQLWAIGGALAFITPIPAVLLMPLEWAWAKSEGFTAPAVLLAAALIGLTWFAAARPGPVASRVWSVAVWLGAWTVMFVLVSAALGGGLDLVPMPEPFTIAVAAAVGIGMIVVVAPVFAWAAFRIGQRWFGAPRAEPMLHAGPPGEANG
jgi:hypothetical protein